MSEKAQANPQGFMTWLQRSVDEHPEAAEAARDERIRLHLARALRQAREAAGMTQELLAKASGLKQAMVSRLEQADHNPTVATVLKYVSALPGELVMGVTVGDSLFGATPACDRTVTLPAHAVDEANRLGLGPREYVLTCVARDQSSRELGALVREEIRANMREMRSWTRATGDAEHEGRPKASFEAATHGKAAHYPVAV